MGARAPSFDCRAVVDREVVDLRWRQLHEGRVLALLFSSLEEGAAVARRVVVPRACVAVVCREHPVDVLLKVHQSPDFGGIGHCRFPIIVDEHNEIGALYDMTRSADCPAWGQVLIDAAGVVRKLVVEDEPIPTDLSELVRCIRAVVALEDDGFLREGA